jgi:hypothetical protein
MCMLTLPYCPIECKAERVLIVDDEGDLRHIVRPLPVREKLTAIRKWFAGEA